MVFNAKFKSMLSAKYWLKSLTILRIDPICFCHGDVPIVDWHFETKLIIINKIIE